MAGSSANGVSRNESPRTGARDEGSLRLAMSDVGPAVRRYLFGMCGDWGQAEDMAQEALLKAWKSRHHFDGRAKAKTWIFTIARNHWRDRLRRAKVRPKEEQMDYDPPAANPSVSPPAALERGELAEAIGRAVAKLPAEQHEALSLRESEGLTFSEIGRLLGVPTATVKSRVRYALLKLADDLKPFSRELES